MGTGDMWTTKKCEGVLDIGVEDPWRVFVLERSLDHVSNFLSLLYLVSSRWFSASIKVNYNNNNDRSPPPLTVTTNPTQAITSYWTPVPIFVGREPSVTKLSVILSKKHFISEPKNVMVLCK